MSQIRSTFADEHNYNKISFHFRFFSNIQGITHDRKNMSVHSIDSRRNHDHYEFNHQAVE